MENMCHEKIMLLFQKLWHPLKFILISYSKNSLKSPLGFLGCGVNIWYMIPIGGAVCWYTVFLYCSALTQACTWPGCGPYPHRSLIPLWNSGIAPTCPNQDPSTEKFSCRKKARSTVREGFGNMKLEGDIPGSIQICSLPNHRIIRGRNFLLKHKILSSPPLPTKSLFRLQRETWEREFLNNCNYLRDA